VYFGSKIIREGFTKLRMLSMQINGEKIDRKKKKSKRSA
jgi:hypothetical protein